FQRYPPHIESDLRCVAPAHRLPLQGEIWCYAADGQSWRRVYQSPNDVAVPGAPGEFTARDIGFRDMLLFAEHDGTEALYVSGVSARTIRRELPPPRLLRSTDGVRFDAVAQDPGTFLGDLSAIGFRALTSYKDRLLVVASNLHGDGALLEARHPR